MGYLPYIPTGYPITEKKYKLISSSKHAEEFRGYISLARKVITLNWRSRYVRITWKCRALDLNYNARKELTSEHFLSLPPLPDVFEKTLKNILNVEIRAFLGAVDFILFYSSTKTSPVLDKKLLSKLHFTCEK